MAKKTAPAKRIKKHTEKKQRRLQTDLKTTEWQELNELIRHMGARSESEAVRRMIHFLHTVVVLSGGGIIRLNVNNEEIIAPL